MAAVLPVSPDAATCLHTRLESVSTRKQAEAGVHAQALGEYMVVASAATARLLAARLQPWSPVVDQALLSELQALQLRVQDAIMRVVQRRQQASAQITARLKVAAGARQRQRSAACAKIEPSVTAMQQPLPDITAFENCVKTLAALGKELPGLKATFQQ